MIGTAPTLPLLLDAGSCCGAMGGWGWMGMMVGTASMIGLILLVGWTAPRPSTASDSEVSAVEILAARYAHGEISKEEYDERRSVLLG